MTSPLVFVPTSQADARALASGTVLRGVQGFTVTPTLLETFGLTRADDEDADRAALQLASVWGLAHHGERLVLVAEVPSSAVDDENTEAHNGGVRVGSLALAQVTAFFTDDPGSQAPARVAPLVRDMDVDTAWEVDELQALLRSDDLLWHDAEELAHHREDD